MTPFPMAAAGIGSTLPLMAMIANQRGWLGPGQPSPQPSPQLTSGGAVPLASPVTAQNGMSQQLTPGGAMPPPGGMPGGMPGGAPGGMPGGMPGGASPLVPGAGLTPLSGVSGQPGGILNSPFLTGQGMGADPLAAGMNNAALARSLYGTS